MSLIIRKLAGCVIQNNSIMEDQNNNKKNAQFSIEIKPDIAKGVYSNLALIAHSPTEFVVDFVSNLPGYPKAEVVSRTIMTPETAKRLMLALQDNIGKYESQFGQIRFASDQQKITLPFGGGHGPQGGNIS